MCTAFPPQKGYGQWLGGQNVPTQKCGTWNAWNICVRNCIQQNHPIDVPFCVHTYVSLHDESACMTILDHMPHGAKPNSQNETHCAPVCHIIARRLARLSVCCPVYTATQSQLFHLCPRSHKRIAFLQLDYEDHHQIVLGCMLRKTYLPRLASSMPWSMPWHTHSTTFCIRRVLAHALSRRLWCHEPFIIKHNFHALHASNGKLSTGSSSHIGSCTCT